MQFVINWHLFFFIPSWHETADFRRFASMSLDWDPWNFIYSWMRCDPLGPSHTNAGGTAGTAIAVPRKLKICTALGWEVQGFFYLLHCSSNLFRHFSISNTSSPRIATLEKKNTRIILIVESTLLDIYESTWSSSVFQRLQICELRSRNRSISSLELFQETPPLLRRLRTKNRGHEVTIISSYMAFYVVCVVPGHAKNT